MMRTGWVLPEICWAAASIPPNLFIHTSLRKAYPLTTYSFLPLKGGGRFVPRDNVGNKDGK